MPKKKDKEPITLDDMIRLLSEDEKEKRYQEANNMVSALKFIGINAAVCQVKENESDISVLKFAIVISESNFDKLKDLVKKNI